MSIAALFVVFDRRCQPSEEEFVLLVPSLSDHYLQIMQVFFCKSRLLIHHRNCLACDISFQLRISKPARFMFGAEEDNRKP